MAGAGPDIRDIIATCLKPFERDGQVTYNALAREIDYIVEVCQADAIATAATEEVGLKEPGEAAAAPGGTLGPLGLRCELLRRTPAGSERR